MTALVAYVLHSQLRTTLVTMVTRVQDFPARKTNAECPPERPSFSGLTAPEGSDNPNLRPGVPG